MASPLMTLCSLEESHFNRKPTLDCWLNACSRDEPPGDSAGRFTRLAAHFANNDP
jgi:hypothetical protein